MNFDGWLEEKYPGGIPDSLDQDALEDAYIAGWDDAQDYFAKGGSFK